MHKQAHCCDEAANHQVSHSCSLLNHPNSFWTGMFKLNTKFDADSLLYLLILNVMATQYTCSLSGVYCPFWLVQWSHHCSPMHIPVHFPWLPGYISAAQTILILLTMARLFPDRSHMLTILDRNYIGWSKNRFMVVSTQNCIFLYYYLLLIVFHMNNCKPTFAPPCIIVSFQLLSATLLWLYLKVMAFFTLLLHCYIIQIGL